MSNVILLNVLLLNVMAPNSKTDLKELDEDIKEFDKFLFPVQNFDVWRRIFVSSGFLPAPSGVYLRLNAGQRFLFRLTSSRGFNFRLNTSAALRVSLGVVSSGLNFRLNTSTSARRVGRSDAGT
jgi:hypothetical protein